MGETIKEGFEVFLADGEINFGAVRRRPRRDDRDFLIYVENAGEFLVPLSAVKDVHTNKVILSKAKLDSDLLHAIGHAHEAEHEDQ